MNCFMKKSIQPSAWQNAKPKPETPNLGNPPPLGQAIIGNSTERYGAADKIEQSRKVQIEILAQVDLYHLTVGYGKKGSRSKTS